MAQQQAWMPPAYEEDYKRPLRQTGELAELADWLYTPAGIATDVGVSGAAWQTGNLLRRLREGLKPGGRGIAGVGGTGERINRITGERIAASRPKGALTGIGRKLVGALAGARGGGGGASILRALGQVGRLHPVGRAVSLASLALPMLANLRASETATSASERQQRGFFDPEGLLGLGMAGQAAVVPAAMGAYGAPAAIGGALRGVQKLARGVRRRGVQEGLGIAGGPGSPIPPPNFIARRFAAQAAAAREAAETAAETAAKVPRSRTAADPAAQAAADARQRAAAAGQATEEAAEQAAATAAKDAARTAGGPVQFRSQTGGAGPAGKPRVARTKPPKERGVEYVRGSDGKLKQLDPNLRGVEWDIPTKGVWAQTAMSVADNMPISSYSLTKTALRKRQAGWRAFDIADYIMTLGVRQAKRGAGSISWDTLAKNLREVVQTPQGQEALQEAMRALELSPTVQRELLEAAARQTERVAKQIRRRKR